MKRRKIYRGVSPILLLLFITACESKEPQIRTYLETHTANATKLKPAVSTESFSSYKWVTPKDWEQKEGSSMRLATFVKKGAPEEFTCTIIVLGQIASQVRPNVSRWMQQLGLTPRNEQELDQFIRSAPKFGTQLNTDALLFNFAPLSKKESPNQPSFLVAMVSNESKVLFIKMQALPSVIEQEEANFKKLVQSLQRG